jgi:hypothetical protein
MSNKEANDKKTLKVRRKPAIILREKRASAKFQQCLKTAESLIINQIN